MGPRWNSKRRAPCSPSDEDLRPEDVRGHEVGRELDARELQVEHPREGAHEQRLAEARHALEEAVPAREEAGEHAVDDVALAHQGAAHLVADGLHVALEGLHGLGGDHGLVGFGHRLTARRGAG
jgi:hypothetical protein